jgi:colicin import membrane protein
LLAKQQAEQAAQGRLDTYSRLVGDKIKRYIVEPPNMQGKPEAVFDVVQIPGGEILSVKLKRSSGNPVYDAAVERAIRRAQPLPPPPDPARFSEVRELELKFRPKE